MGDVIAGKNLCCVHVFVCSSVDAVDMPHNRAVFPSQHAIAAPLQDLLPPTLPIVSVSKGIEVGSGQLMSEVIPSVLSKKHPTVYLSGELCGCNINICT